MSVHDESDPASWRIDASQDCIDLYLELANEPRALSAREASMMVELVDAWRSHEHTKHIALIEALGRSRPPE
jgi:hypothetical protein